MERIETIKNSGTASASTTSGINLTGMITSATTATSTNISSGSTTLSSQQRQQKDDYYEEEKEGPVEIVLTAAQAAAESSSRNPSHGYNLAAKNINKKKAAIAYDVIDDDDHTQRSSCSKDERQSKSIFEIWFDKCIDIIAYTIARILNHPDVRDAASTAILEGMIKLCYVDNLHDHVKNVDTILTEHQVSDAAKKGKDTTKIVKAYLGGIFGGEEKTDESTNNNDNKNK
jgi:hypothetical protein